MRSTHDLPGSAPARSRSRGVGLGLVVALAALLAVPAPAVAVTLGSTKTLANGDVASLAAPSIDAYGSRIHVVFRYDDSPDWKVMYQRSVDSGATFEPAVELSRPDAVVSINASLDVDGSRVDVVWTEVTDDATGATAIYHRYSTNGGTAWSTPKRLTPATSPSMDYPVVKYVGGTVIILFTDYVTGKIYARRSVDGGQTWLARTTLGSTTFEPSDTSGFVAHTRLASGTRLYAGFYRDATTIVVRTSADGGATWAPAKVVETQATGWGLGLAAGGATAMITFGWYDGSSGSKASIRRTADHGTTWSARTFLTSGTRAADGEAVIRAGGKWRLVISQCQDIDCLLPYTIQYRESTDGVTWTTAVRISQTGRFSFSGGLGYTSTNATTWVVWLGVTSLSSVSGNIYVRGMS